MAYKYDTAQNCTILHTVFQRLYQHYLKISKCRLIEKLRQRKQLFR
jgi:hypothetical protein